MRTHFQTPPQRFLLAALVLLVTLFALSGCSKSTDSDDPPDDGPQIIDEISASVNTDGATLTLKNGMSFVVPAGSVSAAVNVKLSQLKSDSLFSSDIQTVLKIDAGGAITSGSLVIPLETDQTADRFGALYMADGSDRAIFLASDFNAGNDTASVAIGSTAQKAFSASPFGVGDGTYVIERGKKYNPAGSYTMPTVLAWPYYEQDGGNCWAAAWLMMMKGYSPHLSRDEIYEILSLTGVEKDQGFGWWSMGDIKTRTETMITQKVVRNTWANYNNWVDYVVACVDSGKPVLANVIDHQVLFVGYELSSPGPNQNLKLIFHDSQNFGDRKTYTTWTPDQIRAQWWDTGIVKMALNYFVTIATTTAAPTERRLQTVHLLDASQLSGVTAMFDKGLAFDSSGRITNFVEWNHTSSCGLKLTDYTEVSPGASGLVLKKVPVWNADRTSPAGIRIKTSLYKVENGVYREPPLSTTETTQAIASGAVHYANAAVQFQPFVENLEAEDTLFAIETAIFNAGLRVDDFDYVFKYRPIRIKELDPTSGEPGDAVRIEGIGFGNVQGSVTFNGVAAEVTSWRNDLISAKVPTGAGSGDVVVTVGTHSSNGVAFGASGFMELMHKTKYPSAAAYGVFTYGSYTGYSVFNPTYIWDYPMVWNGTTFGQHYVHDDGSMIETVDIDGTMNADGSKVTHLSAYLLTQQYADGKIWEERVTEIDINDLARVMYWDDPGEFMVVFGLEKEQISPRLNKLRSVKTNYNSQGSVIAVDSIRSIDWLNSSHEGEVKIWFYEASLQ